MPKIKFTIKNWGLGLVDKIEPFSISPEALSDVKNFTIEGDKIALRRGTKLIGTEITGNGNISGMHSGKKNDGTDQLFITYGRKIKYYDDVTTDDFIEIGTNTLPAAADGEDISFSSYSFLNGNQVFLSSPNSGLWQIYTANPGSIIDLYDATKNYKGYISIKQNRMFLWNRNEANSVVYLSYIDSMFTAKTDVSGEAVGALGSQTYTGTLAFKAGGAKRSCFAAVLAEAGGESFVDNYDGTLTGSAGGTGTINYATGAYSITFNAITTGAVTADYSWFDPTSTGIVDFTFSTPRTAGEGDFFKQGDGSGALLSVSVYYENFYCLHEGKIWVLDLTADDTNATNKIYRELMGIPNWRAVVETGNGIFFIDDSEVDAAKIRILTFQQDSTLVVPIEKSPQLDLSGYYFDKAAMIKFGDYILTACRTSDSDYNNRVLMYDLRWNSYTVLDYTASCFAIYNGALLAGDSISNNVYELFSGYDDLDNSIPAYAITAEVDLTIPDLKKTKELWVGGNIQPDQSCKISINYDNGGFSEIGEIDGNGSYVDRGQATSVGAVTIGKKEIGGGSVITAYRYWYRLKLNSGKFRTCKLKFEPQATGWFDVSEVTFQDIRIKQQRLPHKYRNN